MKYYIRVTNTETGQSAIMAYPVFTSRKKAAAWAAAFVQSMNGKATAEVVK